MLRHRRVEVILYTDLEQSELEQRVPVKIEYIAQTLSQNMLEHVNKLKLGYCPAVGYFQEQGLIDKDLAAALDNVAWVGSQHLQNILNTKLAPLFSTFSIKRMQCTSYMLPSVRVHRPDAQQRLMQFLKPLRYMVDMEIGVIQKHDIRDVVARLVIKQIVSHLKSHVGKIEIKHTEVIGQ